MRDRSILITGCSSGIGYYCAKRLKEHGYNVYTTVRKEDDLLRLKKEGFRVCLLDLDNSRSIKEAVEWVLDQNNGKLFALFNNAAYGQPGAVEDLSREVLREQFETNLFGSVELTNLIIPVMREQGYGRILQHSSLLGFVSLANRGAYNSSKYALEGISDTLRLELRGSGIDVVLIEPGPITSDFRKNALKKFIQNIDIQNSYFKDEYERKLKALQSEKKVPFELDASAVYEVVLKALESKKPKIRYQVTKPTHFFWYAKRVLPARVLDRMLGRIS